MRSGNKESFWQGPFNSSVICRNSVDCIWKTVKILPGEFLSATPMFNPPPHTHSCFPWQEKKEQTKINLESTTFKHFQKQHWSSLAIILSLVSDTTLLCIHWRFQPKNIKKNKLRAQNLFRKATVSSCSWGFIPLKSRCLHLRILSTGKVWGKGAWHEGREMYPTFQAPCHWG